MNKRLKYGLIGLAVSITFFIVFGVVTAVIPNPFFIRMITTTFLDKIFLVTSSILLGSYFAVSSYKKKENKTCNRTTTSAGVGSFLAFACPVCNKLLVLIFGATILMTYLEPYRPILGIVSNGLLVGALYWRIKN